MSDTKHSTRSASERRAKRRRGTSENEGEIDALRTRCRLLEDKLKALEGRSAERGAEPEPAADAGAPISPAGGSREEAPDDGLLPPRLPGLKRGASYRDIKAELAVHLTEIGRLTTELNAVSDRIWKMSCGEADASAAAAKSLVERETALIRELQEERRIASDLQQIASRTPAEETLDANGGSGDGWNGNRTVTRSYRPM